MSPQRHSYLDWLRIMAIIGVLFFHSAMPFAAESEWHIKNKETSSLFLEFNFFLSRFRMPLLFFISGAVAFFLLKRTTATQIICRRFPRLFIPLAFGMLVIVPLQVNKERLNAGFTGNFWDFYPTIFTTGTYPSGNLSWHHLWFIAYLFVYDVALAPLFVWLHKRREKLLFFDWIAENKKIYLLALPSMVAFCALVLRFPETHALIDDWCWFIYWLFFLLAGFCCACFPALLNSLERNRQTSLTFAVVTIFMLNYLRWNDLEPVTILSSWESDPRTYLYLALYPATAWLWVFTAIGYGRRYLNKKHPALTYVNSAVYPFYILHQTVIVVIAWYVVKTNDSILVKYGFVVGLSLFITLAIYHVFIRPFPLTRFFFGTKAPGKKVRCGEKTETAIPMIPAAV
jgi:peptidoglycan/LPS O-acetylase OafA/YrhL